MKVPILELKPAYDELRTELDAAYHRVMESGWLLLGKELEAFEAEYAASIGVKHCVGVANGLEALQLVLMARGIGPGDEVIVPSHGYIATWLAVTHVGARPVPCEPDPQTYTLDPGRIEPLITGRTKAILPIHLYGQTADMPAINAMAERHGLFVLDISQALSATPGEKRERGLRLWPNPAQDQATLALPTGAQGEISISITDATGRMMPVRITRRTAVERTLDTRNFAPGTYAITAATRDRRWATMLTIIAE